MSLINASLAILKLPATTTSIDVIKAAYRTLIFESHPDVSSSSSSSSLSFQQIKEAYDVLHSHFQDSSLSSSSTSSKAAPKPIVAKPAAAAAAATTPKTATTTPSIWKEAALQDVEIVLPVTMEQLFHRPIVPVAYVCPPRVCVECHGTGSKQPKSRSACTHCRGRGDVTLASHVTVSCSTCKGSGWKPPELHERHAMCNGTGFVPSSSSSSSSTLLVDLNRMEHTNDGGIKILIADAGTQRWSIERQQVETSRVHVKIRVLPHDVYSLRGGDALAMRLVLHPWDVLFGCRRTWMSIDGSTQCAMDIEPGDLDEHEHEHDVPSMTMTLKQASRMMMGHGMSDGRGGRGDLLVVFRIDASASLALSHDKIQAIRTILQQ
jgi:DnaJ-class molecular chaperone